TDRDRGGDQPGLSDRGSGGGRGSLRLSWHRPAHGGFGFRPRHSGRPGLRLDLCRHLYRLQSAGRHCVDRDQPQAAAPAMSAEPAEISSAVPETAPPRWTPLSAAWRALKRAPISAWFGLVVIAIYMVFAIFAP